MRGSGWGDGFRFMEAAEACRAIIPGVGEAGRKRWAHLVSYEVLESRKASSVDGESKAVSPLRSATAVHTENDGSTELRPQLRVGNG